MFITAWNEHGNSPPNNQYTTYVYTQNQCKKFVSLKHGVRPKGDKSNLENSTDHFCEDSRQNTLAAHTNLGHVTPFLLLGPPHHLTIQWVREITSRDPDHADFRG